MDRLASIVKIAFLLLVALGIIAFGWAGFSDARNAPSLDHLIGLDEFKFVFVRCKTFDRCQFAYSVNDVDLAFADFGKPEVRLADVAYDEMLRAQNLTDLRGFWTEKSAVAKGAGALGLAHLLVVAIKDSPSFLEMQKRAQAESEGINFRRVLIVGTIAVGVSYGVGYFIAEHWFPNGPGSPSALQRVKDHLSKPEFQRTLMTVAAVKWRSEEGYWTQENRVSAACQTPVTTRHYPVSFATDEEFSAAVMTEPCSRLEFWLMLDALEERAKVARATGRGLRLVDAQMIAGLQRYSDLQKHTVPRQPAGEERYWEIAIVVVATLLAVLVVSSAAILFYRCLGWAFEKTRLNRQ